MIFELIFELTIRILNPRTSENNALTNTSDEGRVREACQKKRGYNEFGTKGGGVSDLNYLLFETTLQ